MVQHDLIGKFLQESFIERYSLSDYQLETNISMTMNHVHSLISLLLQKSRAELLSFIDKEFEINDFNSIHPLDVILFFIQQSPDDYKNAILDALLEMNFAIPLVIDDNIHLDNAKRLNYHRNDEIKII